MNVKLKDKVKVLEVNSPESEKYIGQIGVVADFYKETFGKKTVIKYIVNMDINNPYLGTVLANKVEVV